MDAVLMVVGAVLGIGGGAGVGFALGRFVAPKAAWWFWTAAVLLAIAGVGIAFLGLQVGTDALFVAGVGVIGGGLTGVKYGAHRVPLIAGS